MATNLGAVKAPPASSPKPAPAGSKAATQPRAGTRPAAAAPAQPARHGLPLIGRLAVGKQVQILVSIMVLFLLIAAACVYFNFRQVTQNTQYLATATEMQMLSQRIANSAQQAVQGSTPAFGQLRQSQDQFVENLQLLAKGGSRLGVTVAASAQTIQPALQSLDKLWGPVQKNIALILAQEQNLIELRKREETIARTAPQLSLLALELTGSALDARERYGAVIYARQLLADTANFDFINAVRLLSTDNPNPQVALQLGSNTRQYLRTLKALLGEGKVDGRDADHGRGGQAAAPGRWTRPFAPFAASVQADP